MGWNTNTTITSVDAIVDPSSIVQNSGRQVDFAATPDSYAQSDGNKLVPAFTVISQLSSGKIVPRATTTVITVAVASNVATATTVADHGLAVGDQVFVAGANIAYANGLKTVASVPTTKTFTYTATGSDATATGTITYANAATGVLRSNAVENSKSDAVTGYGVITGGNLYENLMPDATGDPLALPAQYKTELQAAGTGFFFENYGDSRTS